MKMKTLLIIGLLFVFVVMMMYKGNYVHSYKPSPKYQSASKRPMGRKNTSTYESRSCVPDGQMTRAGDGSDCCSQKGSDLNGKCFPATNNLIPGQILPITGSDLIGRSEVIGGSKRNMIYDIRGEQPVSPSQPLIDRSNPPVATSAILGVSGNTLSATRAGVYGQATQSAPEPYRAMYYRR